MSIEAISITKAENLFWLGRYTHRVYKILHFFRKFRDMIIDVDENVYAQFCEKMGVENKYASAQDFLCRYLFDKTDGNSLISALTYAHDNAIVLREEIKSETLAYVQMCVSQMEKCAANNADVNELQSVTDSLMAFWGAVDERIFSRDIRNMIKAGWYLETLDLHIRFDYPYDRLVYLLDRLERHLKKEEAVFDQNLFAEMKRGMTMPGIIMPEMQMSAFGDMRQELPGMGQEMRGTGGCGFDKTKVLGMLGRLFLL